MPRPGAIRLAAHLMIGAMLGLAAPAYPAGLTEHTETVAGSAAEDAPWRPKTIHEILRPNRR